MDSNWRQSRRALFILLFVVVILGLSAYTVYPYFNKSATCFDNKENGDEKGVDCGGFCKFLCVTEVLPLTVKTVKAIPSGGNLYDLVALLENRNKDRDTEDGSIDYTFYVYDKAGSIIKTVSGSTTIPLGQTFPIIVQNIPIDLSSSNQITNVILKISENKNWQSQDSAFANIFFKIESTDFKEDLNGISQLEINIKNISKAYFRNVPVRVIIYDGDRNIIAVNESLIKEVSAGSSKDIFFTWREVISVEDPKIEVYSIVTPYTYIK